MTDPTLLDLARRAVASPHWRWMPGMLVDYTDEEAPDQRFTLRLDCDGWGDELGKEASHFVGGQMYDGPAVFDLLPRLEDPATLGCAEELAREVWQSPELCFQPVNLHHDLHSEEWTAAAYHERYSSGPLASYKHRLADIREPSRAHAIVAALEAAPERSRDDD